MGVEEEVKKFGFGKSYSLDELTEFGFTRTEPDQNGNPAFENDSTTYYFVLRDGKYVASYGIGKVNTSIFVSQSEDY